MFSFRRALDRTCSAAPTIALLMPIQWNWCFGNFVIIIININILQLSLSGRRRDMVIIRGWELRREREGKEALLFAFTKTKIITTSSFLMLTQSKQTPSLVSSNHFVTMKFHISFCKARVFFFFLMRKMDKIYLTMEEKVFSWPNILC